MTEIRQRRTWFLIAAIAIVAVLCLLLVPQAHSGNGTAWLAVLPVFFIGLIVPLDTPWRVADLFSGRAPECAFERSSFQRPPPVRLG
jgi:hypothetical protein